MDCISRKVLYLIISEYFWYFVFLNNAAIKILVYESSHTYSERSRFFFQNFFLGSSGEDFKFLNLYLNRCVIFISLNNMSIQSLCDLFTVLDIYLFPTMKMNI